MRASPAAANECNTNVIPANPGSGPGQAPGTGKALDPGFRRGDDFPNVMPAKAGIQALLRQIPDRVRGRRRYPGLVRMVTNMNDQDFKRFEQTVFTFKEEVKAEFRHQIGIQSEAFQQKLDVLVEGHRMLADKIDRVENRLDRRMDCLEHKLDAVAAQGERNTAAIEGLTVASAKNTAAIEGLTITSAKNAAAIEGLTITSAKNTAAIEGLTIATAKNTAAIEGLSTKLDAVAADLTAHRTDTEAHPPLFRIKE